MIWQGQLSKAGPMFRVVIDHDTDGLTVEKKGTDAVGNVNWLPLALDLGVTLDVVLKCIRDQHTAVQQIHRQLQEAQMAIMARAKDKESSDPTRNPN